MGGRNGSRVAPFAAALVMILPTAQLTAQVNPPPYGQPTPYSPPAPYGQPSPNSQPPPYSAPGVTPGQYESKNPLLMGLVIAPILQSAGSAVANGIGMLFTRLFNALFGHSHNTPNDAAVQNNAGAQTYPGQTYGAPAGNPAQYGQAQPQIGQPYPGGTTYPQPGQPGSAPQYGSPPQPGYPAALQPGANPYPYPPGSQMVAAAGAPGIPGVQIKAALVPSVIYTLNRLDPKTYQPSGQVDLAHGAPTLRTGDVFAIEYSTNVSGQVRIDNIDSRGQTSALGTYTVFSGHDNRIPLKKGIQLAGTTGTETFKMYFYPCAAADANGQPDTPATAAGLPACSSAPSPKLLDASRGLVMAKGAVNLDSPDPTIAVSAVTNYQNTDVTENDFQILHIPN